MTAPTPGTRADSDGLADLVGNALRESMDDYTTRAEHDPGCPGDEAYCLTHCPVPVQERTEPSDWAGAIAAVVRAYVTAACDQARAEVKMSRKPTATCICEDGFAIDMRTGHAERCPAGAGARALLTSDWLASHDRHVRAQALRDAVKLVAGLAPPMRGNALTGAQDEDPESEVYRHIWGELSRRADAEEADDA